MAKHNDFGKKGEKTAIEFLKDRNYEIIETNWKFKRLEVDIIAKIANTLCFIEVKSRNNKYGTPEEALSRNKQINLLVAANEYIESNEIDLSIRFDLIAITKGSDQFVIDHYPEVFVPFQF